MRGFVVMLLLCLSGAGWASDVLLVPENNPKPDYPKVLARTGVMGEVRVGFMVQANGSVSEVEILTSDHPDLAETARKAVSQWRFKPWTADSERPAQIRTVAPFEFRLDDVPLDVNQWIKTWRCSDINAHARGRIGHLDLMPFNYTRAYLSNVFFVKQLPNAERLALIARFNRHVPGIVRRCGSFPATRYVKMLPQEIRELL
jgi:TonB family protein